MKLEIYEVNKTETTGTPIPRAPEGAKLHASGTYNRITFRLLDDKGRVIFSPMKRYGTERHARVQAARYAAELAGFEEWCELTGAEVNNTSRKIWAEARRNKFLSTRFLESNPLYRHKEFPNQSFFLATAQLKPARIN